LDITVGEDWRRATEDAVMASRFVLVVLSQSLREYDKLAQQCAAEGVDFPRYLLRLSELELLDRERRATERRIRQAKFDVVKSLDTFEFLAIPSLNKSLVLDLARCEFIERKENILALGNSGTGKTHIALALGLAACQKGFRVRFTTAASLAHELIWFPRSLQFSLSPAQPKEPERLRSLRRFGGRDDGFPDSRDQLPALSRTLLCLPRQCPLER
jgi:hypothetical protein